MMHVTFATATGSAHVNPGQPEKRANQDAVAHRKTPRGSVTVLCDGCGEQAASHIGAEFGAHAIVNAVAHHCAHAPIATLDWTVLCNDIVAQIRNAAATYAVDETSAALEAAIAERFLFTALVLVVEDDTATVMACGDGIIIADGNVQTIEPPLRNAPPYLGYLLIADGAYQAPGLKQHLAFAPVASFTLSALERGLIVGTDGLKALAEEDLHHPALAQQQALTRWLNAQATESIANGVFTAGRCTDDVTLVIVRTEAAQARLIAARRDIVEVKQQLGAVQERVHELEETIATLRAERDRLHHDVAAHTEIIYELQELFQMLVVRARKDQGLKTALDAIMASARRDRWYHFAYYGTASPTLSRELVHALPPASMTSGTAPRSEGGAVTSLLGFFRGHDLP